MLARQQLVEQNVRDFYTEVFGTYASNELFEVYDIVKEQFVKFPGREASQVMNRDTLIENLSEMESNHASVENLIVLRYDTERTNFDCPAFIGSEDSYFVKTEQALPDL